MFRVVCCGVNSRKRRVSVQFAVYCVPRVVCCMSWDGWEKKVSLQCIVCCVLCLVCICSLSVLYVLLVASIVASIVCLHCSNPHRLLATPNTFPARFLSGLTKCTLSPCPEIAAWYWYRWAWEMDHGDGGSGRLGSGVSSGETT